MTKLPGAKPSPRIAGGVLRWYAGDTFSVTLALELRDQDGDPVTVGASDSLTVSFFDASHAPVSPFGPCAPVRPFSPCGPTTLPTSTVLPSVSVKTSRPPSVTSTAFTPLEISPPMVAVIVFGISTRISAPHSAAARLSRASVVLSPCVYKMS